MKSPEQTLSNSAENAAASISDRAHALLDSGASALHNASDKARQLGKSTDGYVHNNPWIAIGAAAGAGLLIGFLAGRRNP